MSDSTASDSTASDSSTGSDTDYDLIVVGVGGAGLAAAVSAAERGLRVIVFEAEDITGGSTQLSAGCCLRCCIAMPRASRTSSRRR